MGAGQACDWFRARHCPPSPVSGSRVAISEVATGLASNTLYRWRLRILTDSPLFPRSPWFSLPYNCATESDIRVGTVISVEAGELTPGVLVLGSGTPNPFEASVLLRYTLPQRGHVRLAVYDVAGREVAVLRDGEEEEGLHVVMWEGRGVRGSRLPAGVYFVHLESGGYEETRKVVIMH